MSKLEILGAPVESKPSEVADVFVQTKGPIVEVKDVDGNNIFYEILGQVKGAEVNGKEVYRRLLIKRIRLEGMDNESNI